MGSLGADVLLQTGAKGAACTPHVATTGPAASDAMPPHRYGQQHGVQRRAAADARRPWRRRRAGDTRPHLQQHLWPFVGKVPHQHLLQHRHNERGQQHVRDEGRCGQAAGAGPPMGGDSLAWRKPVQGLLPFTPSTSHAPQTPLTGSAGAPWYTGRCKRKNRQQPAHPVH